ncbi:MAG: DUF2304 domain-containing protein [Patescibacteria group bacterium]|jgi:hypothetical protein
MIQQILALIVIIFFLSRLFWQKKKDELENAEFVFWLVFWALAAAAIVFIKSIDRFVADLGFSATGINVLFYVAVVLLFYIIFRLRLRIEKMERNITRIVREVALREK